jgi:alpha-L-fucosidase
VYVILTRWPQESFSVFGIKCTKNTRVSLFGYNDRLEWKSSENKIEIEPPIINPATISCQYAWVFKISDVLEVDPRYP